MSLSPHRRGTLSTTQHGEDLFYDVAARPVDQTHISPEGMMDSSPEVQSAGVFKSEARGPFQPPEPVKWPQPDPSWFHGPQGVTKWPPHFGPCVGDDPGAFQKSEMDALKSDGLSQSSAQSYTDPGSVEYVHHAPFHRPAEFHYQPTGHHDRPDPTLQPFQLAFRPAKPPPAPAFQQGFEGSSASVTQHQQHQHQFLQLQQLNQMQQFHQLQHQHQQQRMHQMQHQYQLQHHTQVQSEPSKGGSHTLHQGAEPDPQEMPTKHPAAPRRSRRLSRDGLSPPALQTCKENGAVGGVQGSAGGVIQSTQRRRRASKEINLETLAQKASEMEFLPARSEDGMIKPASITPLVIPVSVPVHPEPAPPDGPSSWREKDDARLQRDQPDHKPSVIVARRFSLKNSASESITQGDKSRHRPRPEPLVMPKLGTFIAPSIYSSISHHQSNLRSPVGLPDHSSLIPPYTPPPILSPVREGSGLYFSAVLSSMAASSQVLPPPSTPRGGATRSLLRSGSSDLTPPALPLHVEATPVCLEPRINIGSQYQAEVPDLQEQTLAHTDQHKATLVWLPVSEIDSSPYRDSRVVDLVNVASSSVLHGGGTNTELAMHCLHECRGDVMKTLEVMLMKSPVFSAHHPLSDYHYAGSDCWTADEKRYFNKGICAYTKDFFLVQKVVRSKTVAQCVEFYYTYKKQVKAGRGGAVTFGPAEPEESIVPVMNVKQDQTEDDGDIAPVFDSGEGEHFPAHVMLDGHTHQGAGAAVEEQRSFPVKHASGLSCPAPFKAPPPVAQRARASAAPKKSRSAAGNKLQGEPEGIFPCKKCSRVFYKVKSRSAHMKSHAEQEKKAAAAQRQREEEERARQEVLEAAARKRQEGREESSGAEESSLEPDDELDEDWH